MKRKISEFRLYPYIKDRLGELGWNTKSLGDGGSVHEQSEFRQDPILKSALGRERPEFIVVLDDGGYWVIEAKAAPDKLSEAMKQAQNRADKINQVRSGSCRIITGVSGNPDTAHYVETRLLVDKTQWIQLSINKRHSTGFLSQHQVTRALALGTGNLDDYEIDDALFVKKMQEINKILHNAAIVQRGRAEVLACILLALANDQHMLLNSDLGTLINDINTRAKRELRKHGKESFFNEISIHKPTSDDNHVKNKNALIRTVELLRDMNIASAIDSGRDVLGQCYEQFLKYANNAKEIGIVLTPRTITNFAADVIGISSNDKVFDPTCGTGGFLVAALDKARKNGVDLDNFKKGNLYGIEQDQLIATLAIVNMVFRGDGSSNIKQGNSLAQSPTPHDLIFDKVLMNPPFALTEEYEWHFVDYALSRTRPGGMLFGILPTSTMTGGKNERGELHWRQELLKRHALLSVIKLPEELFYPNVSKGTYAVILRAHKPHSPQDNVLWAVLSDGVARSKTTATVKNNIPTLAGAVKNHIAGHVVPAYLPRELDCSPIIDNVDMSPEKHIGVGKDKGFFDVLTVKNNLQDGKKLIWQTGQKQQPSFQTNEFPLTSFFVSMERGESGRLKYLPGGELPLISTSEQSNGITGMVKKSNVSKVYSAGGITISANGGSCYAHYHDYEFAANQDVWVGYLKTQYKDSFFGIFLCAAINAESWRYNYFRKFSRQQMDNLSVKIPVSSKGEIDFSVINNLCKDA